MNKIVSIIIPNFNGKELLRENLPILFSQIQNPDFSFSCEVIVVDDGSTDGSAEFVKKIFPTCKLITLDKNYGFSYAVNTAVRQTDAEIIYLLNSDVKVCKGFLEPLIFHFGDNTVFAVSSIEVSKTRDNAEIRGKIGIPLVKFKYGIFWYWYELIDLPPEAVEVFCVSGGHTAYDREKFLSLGGFDTIFRPIYAEDGDICWRAWKRGWRSLIEPRSIVSHSPQSTIGKFYAKNQILKMHWKNRILLTWKDLTSKWLLSKHIFFLLPEIILLPIFGKKEFTLGFFSALKQFKELLKSKERDKVIPEIYSDQNLFCRFSSLRRLRLLAPTFKGILYLHETARFSGAEESLINLARNLDKNKFRPIFVLPEEGKFAERLRREGIAVYFVEMPKIRKIKGVIKAMEEIKKLVDQEDIDIIHSNSIRTNIYGAIVAKLEKIPIIWHQRNLLTNEWIDPDRHFSFLADKIICNSQAIAKRFKVKTSGPKVKVIYNGVDTERFNPLISGKRVRDEFNIKPDEVVIGIASRFNQDKGHEIFLKAARIVTDCQSPKATRKFLIVGSSVFAEDRWREDYLKNTVEDLGLSNQVIFTGFRDDMPQVYAAMDIFVLASEAEPCGRVILEAMASGKPVIATNSGGTPEIAKDGLTGYLFDPGDHQALANKIIFLANNIKEAKKMGEEGRKRVEMDFKIERNVAEIEAVYAQVTQMGK